MQFPQYRKYSNELSYYIINSPSEFVEYKKVPKGIEVHKIEAKILPDRNFIQDMLDLKDGYWLEVDKVEFENFLRENQKEV